MKRASISLFAAAALLVGTFGSAPANAAPKPPAPPRGAVDVYTADLTTDQLKILNTAGLDHEDVAVGKTERGRTRVEVIMNSTQVSTLGKLGVPLQLKMVKGKSAAQRAAAAAPAVFRPYSGAGNIREEIVKLAADHPSIAKAVDIGTTGQGKPITAVRVSKGVAKLKDGQRPAVLFQATQHAREWITPEMVRRLLHHFVEGYGADRELTKIIDTTDVWFLPVVNVDGYDLTFEDGFRLWRKNLRDNDGDGQLSDQDGVDPNRNFPYRWGYDNEGSSPNFAGETYRGPSAGSEPETKAQIGLVKRVRPKYIINYHSAAELLLHGVGWQALTRSPDDVIHDALLGDIDHPAVPGYTPELGAQLYTTNGETDGHMDNTFGALSITPEMSTCVTASNVDPDDAWEPADCGSGFEFPDDETLIQGEYAKNVALAVATAKSVHDPDDPVSPVGRTVPDFEVDKFSASFGSSQKAASVIRRSLRDKTMNYKINRGRTRTSDVREWQGGERFGDENDEYFAEYRGTVSGQRPGDRVEVWFSGTERHGGKVQSEHFTYTVRNQNGAEVLVIADEDYKGVNPIYPAGTNAPKYAQQYVDAIKANKVKPLVWDIDKDGVPHDLGVLKHFKGVVWYLGENRLTQDAADDPVQTFAGPFPDSQVADRALQLVLNVRSYLNEGGKLLYTGETAGYYGPLYQANGGGIYYGLKGHPERPCVITSNPRDDCELLSDDFTQYYLGSYDRAVVRNPTGFTGTGPRFGGVTADFGGAPANPLNEAGGLQVTSTVLPTAQFPQFRSWKAGDYLGAAGPYEPYEGAWYLTGTHEDSLYRRLTRTIDLSSVTAAQAPALQAQIAYSTELGYDHVLLEAHTVGAEDWTTLPDKNGRTQTTVPTECEADFFLDMHPFLGHYLTGGNPCGNTGSSGAWNSFTGSSGGWVPVAFDLSAYAGKKVEVSIAYVSDPFTGGTGLFVDDTRVTTSGGQIDAEGFETGLGPWAIQGAPAGSPGNISEFVRSQALIDSVSAVATPDSLTFGFGLEQVKTPAERNLLMGRALKHLLD
ncbi:M14 family metallopeptidase [Actinomadura sp. HBU206391]|uniref:M14 family metallopeptidase n=1 Tax=Actinomadura sp. HBU206391 TaxID=2731692 RepID=UPI00164FD4C4|nr:M14 family zinc carboxypeptidase [Actinomadura sp. HBU206391]MBC6460521.1 immune inhibitor A [Actinomadura sp. HBU206391]